MVTDPIKVTVTDPDTGDHMYLSTACLHVKHTQCRRRCKFCEVACVCICHAMSATPTPFMTDENVPMPDTPAPLPDALAQVDRVLTKWWRMVDRQTLDECRAVIARAIEYAEAGPLPAAPVDLLRAWRDRMASYRTERYGDRKDTEMMADEVAVLMDWCDEHLPERTDADIETRIIERLAQNTYRVRTGDDLPFDQLHQTIADGYRRSALGAWGSLSPEAQAAEIEAEREAMGDG